MSKAFITSVVGLVVGAVIAFSSGCASTTEGGAIGVDRKQFLVVSSAQVNDMAAKGYEEMKAEAAKKGALDRNAAQVSRVKTITNRLIAVAPIFRADSKNWAWESHVITEDQINAFCMPGGKMMIYSGIIEKLKLTDAEIAAIMGHEISHALREHGRERISQQAGQQFLVQLGLAVAGVDASYGDIAMQGTNLLLTLPNGRGQELEADHMGLELMARAGYNPEEAVTLWQKMGASGGSKPPEFLSTHPSDERRMNEMRALLPKVQPLYQAARK